MQLHLAIFALQRLVFGRNGITMQKPVLRLKLPVTITLGAMVATFILWQSRPVRAASRLAEVREKFSAADGDKDGKLTKEEAKPYGKVLEGADTNGDGVLTLEECVAHLVKAAQEARSARKPTTPQERTPADAEKPAEWMLGNEEAATPLKQAPVVLRPGESSVGRLVPDLGYVTLSGQKGSLQAALGKKGAVLVWFSPSCPIGKKFLPELKRLEAHWRPLGWHFVFVVPHGHESTDPDADLLQPNFAGPVFRDAEAAWQSATGARRTTDVLVLDAARTVVYHGAVDDQYGVGYAKDSPTHRYLTEALEAADKGEKPRIMATLAPGCELETTKKAEVAAAGKDITYHKDIARLVDQHCLECHRRDGVAPFPLENFQQVSAKAKTMQRVLEDEIMPPWFAADVPHGKKSPWINDRSLTDAEKQLVTDWIAAGKPEGNAADAPLARQWSADWRIGTPDQIWRLPSKQEVKAEGTMPYRKFSVDTALTEDKWIAAWEVRPTARQVVHHVLVYVKEPGQTKLRDDNGDHLASYVPGGGWNGYPKGMAKKIKAGSTLVFEMHYTPNGVATTDHTELGIVFAKEPPQQEVRVAAAANPKIQIPAAAPAHAEVALLPVPQSVKLLSLNPHMHVRGKAFRYELILPDGTLRTLLDVPRYDFNWQVGCRYAEPLTLPAGSKIKCTGWYDNSSGNPANPNPNATVRWGPQTSDEMMLGYLEYLVPAS